MTVSVGGIGPYAERQNFVIQPIYLFCDIFASTRFTSTHIGFSVICAGNDALEVCNRYDYVLRMAVGA